MLETAFKFLYRSMQLYHCFILTDDACFLFLCFCCLLGMTKINDDFAGFQRLLQKNYQAHIVSNPFCRHVAFCKAGSEVKVTC